MTHVLVRLMAGAGWVFVACASAAPPPRFGRAVLDDATASEAALGRAIDPARGLIEIDYYEAGGVQRHQRRCGEALRARLPALASELAGERAQWAGFELTCGDASAPLCVFNPGEVLPHGTRYLFVPAGGRFVLEAIVRFEGGALDTTAQDQFIAAQLAADRAAPCGG